MLPIFLIAALIFPESSFVSVNGKPLTVAEDSPKVLIIIGIWFPIAAFIGPGLWTGNPYARHAFFFVIAVVLLFLVVQDVTQEGFIAAVVIASLIGGYFYLVPGVNSHFNSSK